MVSHWNLSIKSSLSFWPFRIFPLSEVSLGEPQKTHPVPFSCASLPPCTAVSSPGWTVTSFSRFSLCMPLAALSILVPILRMQSKLSPPLWTVWSPEHNIPDNFQGMFQPRAFYTFQLFSAYSGLTRGMMEREGPGLGQTENIMFG